MTGTSVIKEVNQGKQGNNTKNPKTHEPPKFIPLVSIMMLKCRAKNEFKRSSHSGDIL